MPLNKERGFTLVEMVLAVLILGILAYVAIPRITESADKAKIMTCRSNVNIMNRQIEWYFTNEGAWPTSLQTVTGSPKYFPERTPICPVDETMLYEYDATTHRVAFHDHGESSADVETSTPDSGSSSVAQIDDETVTVQTAGVSGGSGTTSPGSSSKSGRSRAGWWSWLWSWW